MYLKKIEAQGFKSFANKAVLEFTPGIMGIVGPNGSGKSNVADAVRWVLGEQSAKQLRGGSMQDVIFSGTEARKAMGYAYVSLTIDNSDKSLPIEYDEVTVTRQVFRSGESEYRINGNTCRLRDVYELFYDSGIGKEGYSIIGQGQIDKVLSNKPEERRQMFDEAAGIVKYKKRKEITAKKLDSERQSLQRINDILGEMERQVGPLEKQSAKAKTYLKLKEELKAYEVGAFYLEASDLEKKLNNTKENLELLSGDLKKSHEEADALKEHYDTLAELNDELDQEMQDARARLSDLRVEKENKEGRIALLTEQIRAAEANKGMVGERLKTIDETLARIEAEKEEIFKQKNDINRQLDTSDDKISRTEGEAEELDDEIRALEFDVEQKNRVIIEAMNEKVNISGDLQGLRSKEEQLRLRLTDIEAQLADGQKERKDKEKDLANLEATLSDMRAEISRLTEEDKAHRESQKTAEIHLKDVREEFVEASRVASVLQSRKENLENLTERYEGYSGSVRKVMEQKDGVKGIRGVVADLITAEKKYETAVETALGGKIQNVVTDTEDCAKKLIGYLKANKLGRVTFLPIDSVSGEKSFPRPEALREDGAIGLASRLVKAEKDLSGVVDFLLGQVLVVSDMDKALRIARKYNYRLHIVTLDGEYLAPGGSISGGAFKNSSNLLGRRRELEEIGAALDKARADAVAARKELTATEALLEENKRFFENDGKRLESLKLKEAALETMLDGRREEARKDLESSAALELEQKKIKDVLEELSAERLNIQKRAVNLDKDNETRHGEVTRALGKLEKHKDLLSEKTKVLEELRLEFANLNQRNEFLLENIRRINGEAARANEEKESILSGAGNEENEIRAKKAEIEELTAEIAGRAEEIGSLEQKLDENREVRERQRGEQQGFFDSREAIANRISDLDKESFRLQSLQQRLEEQIEQQAEYLWTEYEMTPSEAKAIRNPELTSLSEVHRFIKQKKNEIRDLGPVNVGAIEEYKEVSERYEFMKTQQEDLVKAEQELLSMIDELEDGMRKQFREQFAAVKVEFAKVFSELFAGGKGSLELEEGVDVLEAGVIINAQPPGKKLVNMMQLSGGEKALTAIALLFAIQNLKPSPFCLLDEIEAALDEPNVARFADYLNRLKNTTQFIVITHRRGTMEMTDRLYGITMQEKGVSALVSVNLTDPKAKSLIDEK